MKVDGGEQGPDGDHPGEGPEDTVPGAKDTADTAGIGYSRYRIQQIHRYRIK